MSATASGNTGTLFGDITETETTLSVITANTVGLRFTVPQGGDITSAVVKVYVTFKDGAAGGIAVPS